MLLNKYLRKKVAMKMTIKKNNIISFIFLIGIMVSFYIYFTFFGELKNNNLSVILTFILNSFVSIYFLIFLNKNDYSFDKLFWIFNLFFLSLLPFVQYIFNRQPWSGMTGNFNNDIYFYTNILISLWFVSYIFGYQSKKRKIVLNTTKYDIKNLSSFGLIFIYFLTILFIFITYLMSSNNDQETLQSIKLLSMAIIKGITAFGLLLLVNHYRLKHSNILLISLIFLLILYFLFAIRIGGGGRHYLAVVLFGLFFTYFKKLGNQIYFIFMMIIGLIVFPFIGQIRLSKGIQDIKLDINVLSVVASGDFDAYTMFMNIIRYVQIYSYEYGMQLLGAIFFFVPRSIWIDKPVGTGYHVAESFNFFFKNLSAPLIAESYINFGILGIIVFGYIIGKIVKTVDISYWYNIDNNENNYLYFAYPFIMMFFFFMLRGDLLSSYAYIFGFIISTFTFYKFSKLFFK